MVDRDRNDIKKFFEIEIKDGAKKRHVYAPSSINCPRDNTVMFVTVDYVNLWFKLLEVKDCLIFWPRVCTIPEELEHMHYVVLCERPRLEFARFFRQNRLYDKTLEKETGSTDESKYMGKNITIMPGAYIGAEVTMGDNVYIGSGVRLVGNIWIGNNVVIRENSVLGADGLSMEREEDGTVIPIPQFGGIEIGDNVIIGANVVIARGAIDNTIIGSGCIIDNSSFISHNVVLEENVAIVGESIVFGSCYVEKNSFLSGNVTIRDKRKIGEGSFIGMGSVLLEDVEKECIVCGNPAKNIKKKAMQEAE